MSKERSVKNPARRKSPMQLSLDYLHKDGWNCQIVEHWNAFAKIRQDCFGFGDILAYTGRGHIALVQTTSWNNFNARKKKILASPHFRGWQAAGGAVLLQAWGDKGLRDEWL